MKKQRTYYCTKPTVNLPSSNNTRREVNLVKEDESIFEFEDIENCTVIPKDIFINTGNCIIDNILHTKKKLYSKAL